ncbi:hypothetical protein DYU11_19545 [Fibrisoma montanum]|uniref:Uncharacterized protein n=1 Tax=Fibrisoma montanum TaxID=2305895 RepID=A0A418M713_9BACT|nr:hypothetical protein [Fibrisoma montanum]RIV21596.1 hypothetical protein DYU11_19545 [Fibrisoma montanum]
MDPHKEFRQTYLGAAPHTFVIGLIWVLSGLVSDNQSRTSGIVFIIVGGMFIFPLGELIRRFVLKAPTRLSPDNKLPLLFTLLAFTIPLSYPVVYMASKGNINWFFPSLAVLVGAHYLPFYWGYRMVTFLVLAVLIVAIGTVCALYASDSFSISAYLTGGSMLLFAVVNFVLVKNER